MQLNITIGKDSWTVKSFVTIRDTDECYNFDELTEENKEKYAQLFNEIVINCLGYKKAE
jgi:hypothetical protein